jgi:hypothetical protein
MSRKAQGTSRPGVDIECHRCGYAWRYRGTNQFVASCPRCKTSVTIARYLRAVENARLAGEELARHLAAMPSGGGARES